MKAVFVLVITCLYFSISVSAQVKIGGSGSPSAYAVLELDGGANRGLLLPRLTSEQINALGSAPDGLFVYNTTEGRLYYRTNGNWESITPGGGGGEITLPLADTMNLPDNYMIRMVNTASSGGAVLGIGTQSASGVVGYSEDGNGVVGNSGNGTGGYFSSSNGAAIYADGKIGVNTLQPHSPLTFSESAGDKIAIGGTATQHDGIGVQPGLLQIHTAAVTSDIAFGYGNSNTFTESMRIKGNGNVGIGTNSPQSKMHIRAFNDNIALLHNHIALDAQIRSNLFFRTGDYYTGSIGTIGTGTAQASLVFSTGANNNSSSLLERMRITQDGKIGIGTSTPARKLTLKEQGIGFSQESTSGGAQIGFYTAGNTAYLQTHNNIPLHFATNNQSAQMTLTTSGRLGIGTAIPGTKLDVAGKARFVQQNSEDAAIEINGQIKVSGDDPAAFRLTCDTETYWIVFDHPGCTDNPNAIILITEVQTGGLAAPARFAVEYVIAPNGVGYWSLVRTDGFNFLEGDTFNVLVIGN